MSAVEETNDGPIEVIQVLFALCPNYGLQEVAGPIEVLMNSLHKINDPSKPTRKPLQVYAIQKLMLY